MKYGVQLYSVRDSVQENGMLETLRRVAAIGYQSVELAGMGDVTARELRAELNRLGLSIDGAHIGIKAFLPEAIEQTMRDMDTVSCRNLIIPSAKLKTKLEIELFLDQLSHALPTLRKEGFEIGFHNHAIEFLPNADGLIPMDVLTRETDLFFELDTYWAFHAGKDPIALMDTMGDRLRMIHIKDGISSLGNDGGMPLGKGEAPVSAVYQKAIEKKLPLIVESETLKPSGMDEIQVCFDYLKALE